MNYRKIWEQYNGPIPKDFLGRTLEIHHIDGDHINNSIENLKLVTIEEHYNIHYNQGDYWSCFMIANQRLYKSLKEISELSKKIQRKRVEEGSHHFLKQNRNYDYKKIVRKRIKEGNHPFLDKNKAKERADNRVKNKTHHFLSEEFKQKFIYKEHICPHCGKIGKSNAMFRHHFDRCKNNKILNIPC